jgi:hypothetical protein
MIIIVIIFSIIFISRLDPIYLDTILLVKFNKISIIKTGIIIVINEIISEYKDSLLILINLSIPELNSVRIINGAKIKTNTTLFTEI